MRTSFEATWVFACVAASVASASIAACHTEQVVTVPACTDPCCGGNPAAIDCGENPDLQCTEPGDPCTAQEYGCANTEFYIRAPATLPATCTAVEAGSSSDDGGEFFAVPDAEVDDAAVDGASNDAGGALDAGDAGGASDASADSAMDAARACGDGAPDACAPGS